MATPLNGTGVDGSIVIPTNLLLILPRGHVLSAESATGISALSVGATITTRALGIFLELSRPVAVMVDGTTRFSD